MPANINLERVGQGPGATIFLMLSLRQMADKDRFLTLTSSGQLLEQRPLSTVEDRDARVRHVTRHVLQ